MSDIVAISDTQTSRFNQAKIRILSRSIVSCRCLCFWLWSMLNKYLDKKTCSSKWLIDWLINNIIFDGAAAAVVWAAFCDCELSPFSTAAQPFLAYFRVWHNRDRDLILSYSSSICLRFLWSCKINIVTLQASNATAKMLFKTRPKSTFCTHFAIEEFLWQWQCAVWCCCEAKTASHLRATIAPCWAALPAFFVSCLFVIAVVSSRKKLNAAERSQTTAANIIREKCSTVYNFDAILGRNDVSRFSSHLFLILPIFFVLLLLLFQSLLCNKEKKKHPSLMLATSHHIHACE